MNAEQQAIDDWFDSKEGQSCADVKTLDITRNEYLNNRLWKAFTSGLDAGKRIGKDRAKKAITKIIDEA